MKVITTSEHDRHEGLPESVLRLGRQLQQKFWHGLNFDLEKWKNQ